MSHYQFILVRPVWSASSGSSQCVTVFAYSPLSGVSLLKLYDRNIKVQVAYVCWGDCVKAGGSGGICLLVVDW